MNLVNLTPHAINLNLADGSQVVFPASGQVARCAVETRALAMIQDGDVAYPVVENTYGQVEDLPDPEEGTIFLVSALVGTALRGKRSDLYGPDTSPAGAIRDESGKIVAVRGLQKF